MCKGCKVRGWPALCLPTAWHTYSLAVLSLQSSSPSSQQHKQTSLLLNFIFPTGKCTAPQPAVSLCFHGIFQSECCFLSRSHRPPVQLLLALPWPLLSCLFVSPEQVGQEQGSPCLLNERKEPTPARKEGGSHPSAETLLNHPCN
jgi:hypothetical protein